MDADEMQVDPVHDEFFKAQDLADALVRESIQNSLDARLPRSRSPVRVRFRFGVGAEALPSEGVRQYFDGLEPHLTAVARTIHSVLPRDDEPVPYLLIEDFGTRGLTGDPSVDPELEGDTASEKNDFFYFWRNVGRSNKGDVDRGRWGLGKAVFTVASRIRTVFGLTRRADDNRSLLLGQSVLKTHVLDGVRRYPYGVFAHYDREGGLPLPIEDPILLDRFADDFRVDRRQSGLSVVVPYYRNDELSFERIVDTAVRQYFYPILRGDLVVEVVDGSRVQRIDASTVESLSVDESVQRLCALTRWSLEQPEEAHVVLSERGSGAPKWDENVVDPTCLDALRDAFAAGRRIAFRVPLLVKRKKARPAASYFDVFIEQDARLRKPEHHFIRRGITIPDVRASGEKAARALIVIDEEHLSTLLGDAENPAHSDWSERHEKIRTLYDLGPTTVRFVKNSASFLAALLARPPEGRVRDFLADLFWIDAPEESVHEPVARIPIRGTSVGESGTRSISPGAAANGITIAKIAGGFTIKSYGDTSATRRPLRAEVAYRVRSGNPFRKHSPFDFDLTASDGIMIEAEGVRVRPTSANAFTLAPASPKFQVSMKGFDSRRDIVVRLVDESGDAAETELY